MDIVKLKSTVSALFASGKGILAADETLKTIQKRFDKIGITSTPETNLVYRKMLFTSEGIEQYISGVILHDETIRQEIDGQSVPKYLEGKGIIPGIKVDKGAWRMPNFEGEKITEGLDNLRDRLSEYKEMGAGFAKWRAVFSVGENLPTETCIYANAGSMALFAALCQEQDIVPVIEPEVLRGGEYELQKNKEITAKVLKIVFEDLKWYRVFIPGLILKTNMVTAGEDNPDKTPAEVAQASIEAYKESVPPETGGIAFLSGGQSPDMATDNLSAICNTGGPWPFTFSFSRALQNEALEVWAGKEENVVSSQKAFIARAQKTSEAVI